MTENVSELKELNDFVKYAYKVLNYHPTMIREAIFDLEAVLFGHRIDDVHVGQLTVNSNVISLFIGPPDYTHKSTIMKTTREIWETIFNEEFMKSMIPRSIERTIHGTPEGILKDIQPLKAEIVGEDKDDDKSSEKVEIQSSPELLILFDTEATDVFAKLDAGAGYRAGLPQLINELYDRSGGTIPLSGGSRAVPQMNGFVVMLALHPGEVTKSLLTSGVLRRANPVIVNRAIDDSESYNRSQYGYMKGWKDKLIQVFLDEGRFDIPEGFTEPQRIMFEIQDEAIQKLKEIRKATIGEYNEMKGLGAIYRPEGRPDIIVKYAMYISLFRWKKLINTAGDEILLRITLDDVEDALKHLKEVSDGYENEISNLQDDTETIGVKITNFIRKTYQATNQGVLFRDISHHIHVPKSMLQFRQKSKIIRDILEQLVLDGELRTEFIQSGVNKTVLYLPK